MACLHGFKTNTIRLLNLSVILAIALGCSSGDRPELGQVTGTVTLDGEPMPDAMVQFWRKGFRASKALTKPDGTFELVYLRDIKGVALGAHDVYIDRVTNFEISPKHLRLPARYNDQSTLERVVEPGKNEFAFDLTSDP
ncbi:MAG: carboxypeptidase regulatory-like domain-containing protein [Pirellulales bacterium]|nr:carboxypeptidase regulatory-like domain-containing protein [Pirellulales bacterium]